MNQFNNSDYEYVFKKQHIIRIKSCMGLDNRGAIYLYDIKLISKGFNARKFV